MEYRDLASTMKTKVFKVPPSAPGQKGSRWLVPGSMKGAKAHPYGQPSSGTRSLGLSFKNQSILEKEFRFRNAVLTNRGHHLPQKYTKEMIQHEIYTIKTCLSKRPKNHEHPC